MRLAAHASTRVVGVGGCGVEFVSTGTFSMGRVAWLLSWRRSGDGSGRLDAVGDVGRPGSRG